MTDQDCKHTWTVQVKTNATTFNFWLLNSKAKTMWSERFAYAFVNLRSGREPEYYIVPSNIVAERMIFDNPSKTGKSKWSSIPLK